MDEQKIPEAITPKFRLCVTQATEKLSSPKNLAEKYKTYLQQEKSLGKAAHKVFFDMLVAAQEAVLEYSNEINNKSAMLCELLTVQQQRWRSLCDIINEGQPDEQKVSWEGFDAILKKRMEEQYDTLIRYQTGMKTLSLLKDDPIDPIQRDIN